LRGCDLTANLGASSVRSEDVYSAEAARSDVKTWVRMPTTRPNQRILATMAPVLRRGVGKLLRGWNSNHLVGSPSRFSEHSFEAINGLVQPEFLRLLEGIMN
jgi:hypothetical protein